MKLEWIDLGLTYEQAIHGVQSGVAYEMTLPDRQRATEPKHLRVGVNLAMVDHGALAYLLIEKGLFTVEEYKEALRLAANQEVAKYESLHPGIKFR